MSDNGFQDMSDHFGNLTKVTDKVTLESLEEAANFYVSKLLPRIPVSLKKKNHMKDHIKVEIVEEEIIVKFDDMQFYWRFVENGTVNQKAQHFASGTFEQYKNQIESIMIKKVMENMRG